ncbi:MAG: hypothetical protein CFE26_06635, partial [Verrucomicrobiales bacterium VVV1]
MSWISQNYEKAAVGGAVVVAAGLAFLGWSKVGQVEVDFNISPPGGHGGGTAVAGAEAIPRTESSLTTKRVWTQAKTETDRAVDLFTGIPLFVKKSEPTKAVDPSTGDPVHPPIPNSWWLENRLDPGFGDSPQRDPDADGFSNLEEHLAKTNPNDEKSHPSLIAKLKYVTDESISWLLQPGFYDGNGAFAFKYFDSRSLTSKNSLAAGAMAKPGDIMFEKEPAAGRFKMLSSERRSEENPSTHAVQERTYVKVEDLKPNKKGKVYEIPTQIPDGNKPKFYQYDRKAVLSLEALGESGKLEKVEENTRFGLPFSSAKKDYLLKSVTPEKIEV